MYLFVKSPQGIRDLRHRVLVFLSAMFWQPIPACDFSRQKAVVFSSEGWPYLHVNLSTIDTRTSKYLLYLTKRKKKNVKSSKHELLTFDNHSMYNVWYENELVGWIMMAYTLLQNSSVSSSSLQVLFEHDRPRIGFLS